MSHFVLHYICICKQLTKKVGQDCINLAVGLDFGFETICTNSHKIYGPAARRKAGKRTCNVMAGTTTLDRNNNFFLQGVQGSTLNFFYSFTLKPFSGSQLAHLWLCRSIRLIKLSGKHKMLLKHLFGEIAAFFCCVLLYFNSLMFHETTFLFLVAKVHLTGGLKAN